MCSIGFCLAFLLVQIIFFMHCKEQKTAEIMQDGRVAVRPEINVEEVLKKFSVKFYQKRFVEDQNLVVAPLLVFKVFASLYDVMDASARYDLHSLADIPQNASAEKMQEFETFTKESLEACPTPQSQVLARMYYDKSIGKINSAIKTNNIETVPMDFSDGKAFLKQVNDWIKNTQIRAQDDLVHDYDVSKKTKAFLTGAFSFDWPTHLTLSKEEKTFHGEKIPFLEGNIHTSYAKLDHHKIEVVELKLKELPKIKLWFILPGTGSSIKEFSDKLTVDIIKQIASGLAKQTVSLSLPRLSIEYNSQEDAYVMEVFEVFTSLFRTPSIKLAEGKEDLYPVKSFLMKCILRLNASETTSDSKAQSAAKPVAFDRPFVLMMLTESSNVPLMVANYFSPKDKLRALEDQERQLKAQAQEHMDL